MPRLSVNAAEITGKVHQPNVKLMFDIDHVGVGQGDVLMRLGKLLPPIGHMQLTCLLSPAEPDKGEIAYDRVPRGIEASGYTDWIGYEYKSSGETDAGLEWVEALGFSRISQGQ